ncbi:hypothetical protein GCM10009576_099920 [Streptomyces rhizosphaericus]|uniref:Uncharacterized protein n=1 Tax=Streptomyces rhizosphaericus TaxID=114699 RepID=A0ABN1TGM9_9ACTN
MTSVILEGFPVIGFTFKTVLAKELGVIIIVALFVIYIMISSHYAVWDTCLVQHPHGTVCNIPLLKIVMDINKVA